MPKGRKNSWLKLDLNENLYGEIGYARLPEYEQARQKIAEYAGVPPSEIVITNGSTQALESIFAFLFSDRDKILLPVPTFTFYTKFEKSQRLRFKKIPYRAKSPPIDNLLSALKPEIRGVYLANPNNPLGYRFSKNDLRRLTSAAARIKARVIVDEAYFEFGDITAKSLIRRFPNLIVTRTFSKAFGLAGLRLGYIITRPKTAKLMEERRGPALIINRPGLLKVGQLKPADIKKMRKRVYQIQQSRDQLMFFCRQQKIKYWPSKTNFVTIKTKNSATVTAKLKEKKILVADLAAYPDGGSLLKNCVRITAPRLSDLPRLKKALDLVLASYK